MPARPPTSRAAARPTTPRAWRKATPFAVALALALSSFVAVSGSSARELSADASPTIPLDVVVDAGTHVRRKPVRPTPTLPPTPIPAPTATPRPTVAPTPTSAPTPRPTAAPTAAPTTAPATPAPSQQLALGVWSGQPWEPANLDSVATLIGGRPHVYMTYAGWDRPFYAADEQAIATRGAAHILTWEPWNRTLRGIANGSDDTFVRAWARGAAAWGRTIYLRPMHEMNGDWYPWGRGVNGNTPADFIAAWRHLHDIFVAEGAANVKWIWSPNVRYGQEYPLADLYPGSSYVDWVGLDGYNWGTDPHLGQPAWQSFGSIFGSTYSQVTAVAPGKPMVIAETASTEHGGSKSDWILKTFLQDVASYPAIRSVIWFNQADGASDFRINSSSSSLSAFKQVYNSALWSGTLP